MSGLASEPPIPISSVLPDAAARVRLGANPRTSAAMLEDLATDPAIMVRAALALNPQAPPRANQILAADADERVRALLARKLAGLAPGLSDDEQNHLQRAAYDTLITLVEDEAVRVRAAIADVIRQMPNAPRGLILRLARDVAVSVSEPVIRFSPLLGDADLLALVNAPPAPATVVAVARRPDLTAQVADEIAAGEDNEAICALLANKSAQLREATLDALIARAAEHADWHEPLVRRPVLPPRSALALSSIIATHLLQVLASRADLDPKLADELHQRLQQRLAEPVTPVSMQGDPSAEQAIAAAHRLQQRGKLSDSAVRDALQGGQYRAVAAMMAVAAGVSLPVVDRAASLRSAKGLVSLVWKAGFSMQLAVEVQAALGHLAPSAILTPATEGGYPLSTDEMRWQVDFLRRMGR